MALFGTGALKGLMVTLGYIRRKPFTTQYPEDKLEQSPRFRGNTFIWYEERCTGCATCAKGCPLGIIRIVTHPEPHSQVGSDYHVDVFDIDTGRCMFCALCVEVCPYDALHMAAISSRRHTVARTWLSALRTSRRCPRSRARSSARRWR